MYHGKNLLEDFFLPAKHKFLDPNQQGYFLPTITIHVSLSIKNFITLKDIYTLLNLLQMFLRNFLLYFGFFLF